MLFDLKTNKQTTQRVFHMCGMGRHGRHGRWIVPDLPPAV